MKILIDLTPLYDHLTGIERFAMNISYYLIKLHPENEYILLFKEKVHERFIDICRCKNIKTVILPSKNKFVFRQITLLSALKHNKADCYLFLSFVSPFLFRSKFLVNTIHDMSSWDCPGSRKWYLVLYSRLCIKKSVSLSSMIVTVSNFSKSRIESVLKIPKSNIFVCYNGISDVFQSPTLCDYDVKLKYNLPDTYILCLSTVEPRKNMSLLIKAYNSLNEKGLINSDLVIVGRKGWKLEQAIGDISLLTDRIHFTGFVEDIDLPYIYKNARFFVFPSLYEGFGIPVIEAMSQGTIVVSSDSTSLPEVACDAAIYFKSNSLDSLEKSLIYVEKMAQKEREEYIIKGINQSKKYRWDVESEKLYQMIIDNLKG